MAVRKRYGNWYVRFRCNKRDILIATDARLKSEALAIESAVKTAVRTQDFSRLDYESRLVCIRLFKNRGWKITEALRNFGGQEAVADPQIPDNISLWEAVEACLSYPDVRRSKNRARHEQAFFHITNHWGKELPVRDIWIPHVKEYQSARLSQGAKPSTINKEKAALSKMFQVLIELRVLDVNPARQVKDLSEKADQRHSYISFGDFKKILDNLPEWVRPIVQVAFFTGMRRGEILSLTPSNVNLSGRMIRLGPECTKEGQWKRVPIHKDLLPVMGTLIDACPSPKSKLFLIKERAPSEDSIRKPWVAATTAVELDPAPTFHDLRHTWKANARRSGMDPEIRESIMGHWFRGKGIAERYGKISDQELLEAIDGMKFENGETEIQDKK